MWLQSTVKMTRTQLAYLTAPLVPAILLACMLYAFADRNWGSKAVFLSFLVFGYIGCWALGPLLVLILKKLHLLSTLFISIGGAVMGFLVFYFLLFLFAMVLGSHASGIPSLPEILWGGGMGFSIALSFGLIAGFPLFKRRD
jgi:hypothetical protein